MDSTACGRSSILGVAAGTAAADPRAHGTVPALIDWLHLMSVSVWIGGLVQLTLLPRPVPVAVARRMRTLATCALAVLVPSGVYAACLHVPSLHFLAASAYGRTLLVKLALAAVLVGLGAVNHFRDVPALLRGERPAAHRLARAVRMEVVAAALVLLLSALLGVLPMPHSAAP